MKGKILKIKKIFFIRASFAIISKELKSLEKLQEQSNSTDEQGAADRLKHTRDENRRGSILHTITKRR